MVFLIHSEIQYMANLKIEVSMRNKRPSEIIGGLEELGTYVTKTTSPITRPLEHPPCAQAGLVVPVLLGMYEV